MGEKTFDRNAIIGIVMICLILVIYSVLNRPSEAELKEMKRQQDSILALNSDTLRVADSLKGVEIIAGKKDSLIMNPDSKVTAETAESLPTGIGGNMKGAEMSYVLENENIKVAISNKGGKIISVILKNYRTHDSLPLALVDSGHTGFGLNFFANNRSVSTNDLFFVNPDSSRELSLNDNADSVKKLTLLLQESGNRYIKYRYSLEKNSYLLDFNIDFIGMDSIIPANTNYVMLNWNIEGPRQEKNLENERMYSGVYYMFTDGESSSIEGDKDNSATIQNRLKWIAFQQQFFTSALIAKETFDKPTYLAQQLNTVKTDYVKHFSSEMTIPYDHKPNESFAMSFYFGPNHYQTLKHFNLGLEEIVPLGWGIFGWVNKYFIIPVFNFLNRFTSNYGLIILLLTIIIKTVLYPLTFRTYLSSAKMKVLKPEIDVINERYPKTEDALKKQQATMELYRKAGINPLGGCLPVLFQMPILIAMFRFFPASIELRQQSFLWATDLSSYDSIWDMPFNIPFYGDHVSLFTILMTASTLLYTWINQKMMPASPQMAQMKWMMYLMPVMFLGIFNNYSAALSYYYFLVNIISFGQQYLMKFFVNEEELKRKIAERRKQPVKKSMFQQRLEKMAKNRGLKMPK